MGEPVSNSALDWKEHGKPLGVSPTPGSYMRIARASNAGDTVALEMPMTLHAKASSTIRRFRRLYGPMVLAGQFPLAVVPTFAEKPA